MPSSVFPVSSQEATNVRWERIAAWHEEAMVGEAELLSRSYPDNVLG